MKIGLLKNEKMKRVRVGKNVYMDEKEGCVEMVNVNLPKTKNFCNDSFNTKRREYEEEDPLEGDGWGPARLDGGEGPWGRAFNKLSDAYYHLDLLQTGF